MSWDLLYYLLRPLRILVAFLALTCFVVIATGMRFNSSTESSFMDFQQMVINGALFITFLYSSFGRAAWTSTYRSVLVSILCALAILYGITLVVRIQNHDGCSSGYYDDDKTRCVMQYVISAMEIMWAVLLFLDGAISYHQSKDVKWQTKMRQEEEERAQANAVHYQPDLSLHTEEGGDTTMTNGLRNNDIEGDITADPAAVELEQLPAYAPRAPKDQPRILDMTNVPQATQAPVYYASPPTTIPQALVYQTQPSRSIPVDTVGASGSGSASGSESGSGSASGSGSGSATGSTPVASSNPALGSSSSTPSSAETSTQAAAADPVGQPPLARLPSYAP